MIFKRTTPVLTEADAIAEWITNHTKLAQIIITDSAEAWRRGLTPNPDAATVGDLCVRISQAHEKLIELNRRKLRR